MKRLVLQYSEQRIQAQSKRKAGRTMALKCEFCGKAPHYGNVISHANNTRRRRWNPNLKRVRAVVAGVKKQVRVCTACIRAGRVKKAA
jgi:large subunit ribosomal protein L28